MTIRNSHLQHPSRKKALVLVLIGLLTGCAVAPSPMTQDQRQQQINDDKKAMFMGQEAVAAPITLEDAVARALKYNLDNRLKLMEEALATGQLDLANFNMLPRLTANAGYASRDNLLGSSSYSIADNKQIVAPSTSLDKSHTTTDLTLSWNILDFGVSYYQAKQQADQSLIAQERRRKVVQNMTQQIRQAYWQAVGAQVLEARVAELSRKAEQALKDSRTIELERLKSPLDSLNYQRSLLETLRQLELINDELTQAKPRLAALMNLPPNADFQVVVPADMTVPGISADIEKLEETALLNRPELMEASYNERVSVYETRKAIARLFPGIEFSYGLNHDSNSYLVNKQWNAAGVRVNWNLLSLLSAGSARKVANAQLEVAHEQRLALSMSVLTQVQLAYRDYQSRINTFARSKDINAVDSRILIFTRNAANSNSESRLQEIRADANALNSELRQYQSYGALQGAYGQVLTSLGVDLLPKTLASNDLTTLSDAVKNAQIAADTTFASPIVTTAGIDKAAK